MCIMGDYEVITVDRWCTILHCASGFALCTSTPMSSFSGLILLSHRRDAYDACTTWIWSIIRGKPRLQSPARRRVARPQSLEDERDAERRTCKTMHIYSLSKRQQGIRLLSASHRHKSTRTNDEVTHRTTQRTHPQETLPAPSRSHKQPHTSASTTAD